MYLDELVSSTKQILKVEEIFYNIWKRSSMYSTILENINELQNTLKEMEISRMAKKPWKLSKDKNAIKTYHKIGKGIYHLYNIYIYIYQRLGHLHS